MFAIYLKLYRRCHIGQKCTSSLGCRNVTLTLWCEMPNWTCLAVVVSTGDWRGGEERNRGRCSVCHHGSRTPAGRTVQSHLLQQSTHGGARHKPVVEAQVCQLNSNFNQPRVLSFFVPPKNAQTHLFPPTLLNNRVPQDPTSTLFLVLNR